MIGSTRRVAVYAYTAPADMRKGYDGLSALVDRDLGRDPLSGEMFLFVSRDRKRSKVSSVGSKPATVGRFKTGQ